MVAATLSAFAGAIIGKKLMTKVTINFLQNMVGIFMIAIGCALILNLI
jgi:uncharacterized membrane protein YfcA